MSATDVSPNPLVPLVLELLRVRGDEGFSEHELLKTLESRDDRAMPDAVDSDLRLFQRHFLLMNALYRLQDVLWREESVWLSISPLRIAIERAAQQASAQALAADANTALRDYYLDWREFESTDAAAVAGLLDSFWQRFHAQDRRLVALATLQLPADAQWDDVQRQYRRLAAATHPDRGGDNDDFLAVREAYEVLRVALRPCG